MPSLHLLSGTVEGNKTQSACDFIVAGDGYGVGENGGLKLVAPRVILRDGFSVESGGSLTAGPQSP